MGVLPLLKKMKFSQLYISDTDMPEQLNNSKFSKNIEHLAEKRREIDQK